MHTTHKSSRILNVLISLFLGVLPTATFAQILIDTSTGWSGTQWVGPIGENGSTLGQSVTAPVDGAQLDSFSFWIGVDDFGPLRFAAYIAAWNGTRLTGPLLYESPVQTLPGSGGPRATHKVTFNTEGLQLIPGGEYVAFISTSQYHDGVFDQGALGYRGTDVHPQGQTFYQNNGTDFASLFQNSWNSIPESPGSDLVFQAAFAVPEPSACCFLIAFLCVAVRLRQRFW